MTLIAALRPMRARRPQARFAMLSTAWSRTDPFWTAWAGDEQSWIAIQYDDDVERNLFAGVSWSRSGHASVKMASSVNFSGIRPARPGKPVHLADLYERATQAVSHHPSMPRDSSGLTSLRTMSAARKDRSTAVSAADSPFAPRLLGNLKEFEELPQGLYGSARADALATLIAVTTTRLSLSPI